MNYAKTFLALFITGSLLDLVSDIFFMQHLAGARTVYWTGFALSFAGGLGYLVGLVRGRRNH